MGSRTRRLAAALGLALVGTLAPAGVSGAQVAPPQLPPLPPLPPEANPVLTVVAPIASPTCGSVSLLALSGAGLLPPALGAGPLLGFAVAPAFIVCGNVPVPASGSEQVCAVDDQVLAALSTVTFLVIGAGPPVSTRLVGPVVEVVTVAEGSAPGAVADVGTAGLLSDFLACRANHPAAAPAGVPPAGTTDAAPDDTGEIVPDLDLSEGFDRFALTPRVSGDDRRNDALPEFAPAPVAATAWPFDYPIVFVLPLVLLAVGGYLARSLTEDVRLPS